jgi:Ca2+-binding EF-hand superfamily protein/diadenosine tetraphosphatase ApaH/serine/threonine PP2A family protein phosphatase
MGCTNSTAQNGKNEPGENTRRNYHDMKRTPNPYYKKPEENIEKPTVETRTATSSNSSNTITSPGRSPKKVSDKEAVVKIQKLFRRTTTQKRLAFETQWKIFNELTHITDEDAVRLGQFMQTVFHETPVVTGKGHVSSNTLMHVDSVTIDDDAVIQPTMNRITSDEASDYELPIGEIDENKAKTVFDLYKHKSGKLNIHTVQYIINEATRKLKRLPNINRVNVGTVGKVTVVGDIRGHLSDVCHIIEEAGWPSENNKYIFNGGFVNSGVQSVECIILLLVLFLAYPNYIFLNRGSQEDRVIANVYGFQKECATKYDSGLFLIFSELFKHIPLFAIINDTVFVVHGGLFHNSNTKLEDLEDIVRLDYKPEHEDSKSERRQSNPRGYYLRRLQQDAMWSDPHRGCTRDIICGNRTGLGVMFGPQLTNRFLQINNLKMIVRSHEPIPTGFERPFQGNDINILCSVFSTANFNNSGNDAAYIVFFGHRVQSETSFKVNDAELWYNVYSFAKPGEFVEKDRTQRLLHELILRKWNALKIAFMSEDTEGRGRISKIRWAAIMHDVTKVNLMWMHFLPILVHSNGLFNMGHEVDYNLFLGRYKIGSEDQIDVDKLYIQRRKLEAVFNYFDTDGNGFISKEEFRRGCTILNRTLPNNLKITDPDSLLKIMDIDGNDRVDLNEFFEVFRILDSRDGNVDGIISIAMR